MIWPLLIALLLIVTPVSACTACDGPSFLDHVTLRNNLIPGSYITEYGGPNAILIKQFVRTFKSMREDFLDELYTSGTIDGFERDRFEREYHLDKQTEKTGRWWHRKWFESFTESKGGAPETPFVVRVGKTFTIFDLGFVKIKSDGGVEWRELKATIDFKAERNLFTLEDSKNWSGVGWKIAVQPVFKVGFSKVQENPLNLFKEIGFRVKLKRYMSGHETIHLNIKATYKVPDDEFRVSLIMDLVRW